MWFERFLLRLLVAASVASAVGVLTGSVWAVSWLFGFGWSVGTSLFLTAFGLLMLAILAFALEGLDE